ncbi:MAG: hypothetical protein UW22_C0080G0003 [Candidatus Gottesmanbacteria bacterium GW2011_GWB1_44_11c]|uniref:Uncharacterized protein n=2 Tax=Candidatus Gottesmaniibacteriota TaxID=1752720 RepID=A0A0G1LBP5_9BACT|nr:MAG: hypothetical protein UW22_C0080G0003 [Candidatus Gottesmanbacteria bacterium GW2011_GWB1_44_11c]KKT57384.1 MAG: hypothetical protein UW52_C0068G0015 [Candidatus Gottesmanbacteria bacterium GW2011_GWA1_44_24b]HCM81939.1 hypothetical protein [Patescibacteria group bacterium]
MADLRVLVVDKATGQQLVGAVVNGYATDTLGQVAIPNAGKEGDSIILSVRKAGYLQQKGTVTIPANPNEGAKIEMTRDPNVQPVSQPAGHPPLPSSRRGTGSPGGVGVQKMKKTNWVGIVLISVFALALVGLGYFAVRMGGKVFSGGAVATEPVAGGGDLRSTDVPPEPTPLAPPKMPSPEEAVDPGSAPWKSPSQWMTIGMGAMLVLALVADTFQKIQHRGKERHRVENWVVWVSLVATVLGVIYVWWSDSQVIRALTPTGESSVAMLIACALWTIAFFATRDPSYPAFGLAAVSTLYLVTADKTRGALGGVIGFPDGSAMYNLDGVFRLISNNQTELAKFSITIYLLLVLAMILWLIDLIVALDPVKPRSFLGVVLGVIGGVLVFAISKGFDPRWGLILLLGGIVGVMVVDHEDWDEGISLAIVLGLLLGLAFATPLVG